ncbi:MAG: hypothetical protein AAFN65_08415, partial [Bacteroidota bacterium]
QTWLNPRAKKKVAHFKIAIYLSDWIYIVEGYSKAAVVNAGLYMHFTTNSVRGTTNGSKRAAVWFRRRHPAS